MKIQLKQKDGSIIEFRLTNDEYQALAESTVIIYDNTYYVFQGMAPGTFLSASFLQCNPPTALEKREYGESRF